MRGKIVKGIAGFYYVSVAGSGIYECKAKGIFRSMGVKPLVGDNVEITVLDETDHEGSITKILPRKNEMIRPAAANVDQALILFALKSPDPNFQLLDRFLISMEQRKIPAAVCFNKEDAGDELLKEQVADRYRNCGSPLLFMSVRDGTGTGDVRSFLDGKTTILAGPSGVGKSSFANAMLGTSYMETGEISRKLARGKNTTRHTELVMIGKDTYLMDTPGFSLLDTQGIPKEELGLYFPEFRPYIGKCRFQGCAHISEPDCAVKDAVRGAQIPAGRYDSYRYIYEELLEMEKRRY